MNFGSALSVQAKWRIILSIKNTKSTWKAQVRLQMKITTNGLVIKEQTTGESDRLVTLLTADYGILRAFVRRAKLVKSRTASATSLFHMQGLHCIKHVMLIRRMMLRLLRSF